MRLIPAHAGKTESAWGILTTGEAHPRSRGENRLIESRQNCCAGSSPLTRGKRLLDDVVRLRDRLIPAHAGKTRRSSRSPHGLTAHPRSRGENIPFVPTQEQLDGSSPLTRGKPPDGHADACRTGLIPAHAGKTSARVMVIVPSAAHPRSRGENRSRREYLASQVGSSPLTRGKHFLTCVFIAQIGQILESLELCASSESYSSQDAYATGAPQDQVRSIGLVPRSSRDAS